MPEPQGHVSMSRSAGSTTRAGNALNSSGDRVIVSVSPSFEKTAECVEEVDGWALRLSEGRQSSSSESTRSMISGCRLLTSDGSEDWWDVVDTLGCWPRVIRWEDVGVASAPKNAWRER